MELHIRDILGFTRDKVAELPSRFRLKFDDGMVVEASRNKTIYSDYCWDLLREYPNCTITSAVYVESVLGGKPLGNNTHIKLLECIFRLIVHSYNLQLPIEKERLLELIYIATNKICNEVTKLAEANVTTLDILDFIEVVEHPKIKAVVDSTKDTYASITKCYKEVSAVLKDDPALDNNNIAISVRSGMVNLNQTLQAVAVRGKVTEVDGTILPNAIMSNFTKGLSSLYEFTAESRSAAKSLYFSDAKLEDTEYAARRLQLLTMVLERIEYVDCGAQKLMAWKIKPPIVDEAGTVTYPGDQHFMIGKYYKRNLEDTELLQITGSDPSLYDQTIHIRSPIHCELTNPHNVCEVCFGALAKNVSRFANIGHLTVITMTEKSTQSVLSTKHLDFSSSGASIVLDGVSSKYFKVDKTKTNYILKDWLATSGLKIVIAKDEATGLTDVKDIHNLNEVSPMRVSAIEHVELHFKTGKELVLERLYLPPTGKKVVMTMEFLKYAKARKWKINSDNNFVFDLDGWDFNLPIFKLPEVEYSFSDHSAMIATVIESNMKNQRRRAQPGMATSILQELFMITNSKLSVNMVVLETIIYGCMIAGEDDYGLARKKNEGRLGVARSIMKNRSLGMAYAYQGIHKLMITPRSFFKLDRPDCIFDAAIAPAEYLAYKRRD